MRQTQGERVIGLLTALLFAVVAATLLTIAYSYSKASGLLPRFAGWIFLALALLEAVIQLKGLIDARRGPSKASASTGLRPKGELTSAVKGFLWVGAMLGALWFAGFVLATPAFIFGFLWVSAGQGAARSAAIATLATAVVWLAFVELLEYELYAGVLFRN